MATPRLVVKVVEARRVGFLGNEDEPVKPADIYCEVVCGEDTFKTRIQEQTTSPVWEQEVVFGGSSGVLGTSVAFTVKSSGRLGDQVLGQVEVDVDGFEANAEKRLTLVLTRPTPVTSDAIIDAVAELVVDVLYEPDFNGGQQISDAKIVTVSESVEQVLAQATIEETTTTTTTESATVEETTTTVQETAVQETTTTTTSVNVEQIVTTAAPELPTKPPNYILVTILEGKDLIACDGTGPDAVSDPVVKIKCSKNESQKTTIMEKTLHPKWRQRFYFYKTPARQVLDLIVEDNDMFTNDFMGQCSIDLEQWQAHFKHEQRVIWLALEPKKAKGDVSVSDISPERNMNYGLGKICISIEMRYIERAIDSLEQGEQDHVTIVPSSKQTRPTSGTSDTPVGVGGTQTTADGADGAGAGGDAPDLHVPDDDEDNESVTRETSEELKKKQEERQKMFAELSNVQFLSGDYQILVRIIEVRDLKPSDANGLCDPVVSVECLGQLQHTMVKEKQLSCVFDEYLAFNFKDLDKDVVEQGSIKITVIDADGPSLSRSKSFSTLLSDTVGFFVVDIPYVYYQQNHEVHRKWVALVGSNKNDMDSIRGYLLLSIVVLGPGDKLRIHPPQEDRSENDLDTAAVANDANSLVLIPPRVTQTLSYLVVTIFQAQDLPDMDEGLVRQGGIDGYIRVSFAGQHVVETKRVTVKGRGNLTVEFNQELWFPVLLPTMSNNIFISVWDWDLTADELVGNTAPYHFNQVQKFPNLFTPHWTNIYGPPIGYKGQGGARKHLFDNPKIASTYRGRVQLSLRIEDGSKSVNDRPHTRNLMAALPQIPTKTYALRAAVFFGSEIPRFISKQSWSRNSKMSLKFSIGSREVATTRVENRNGMCHWNQYIDIPDVALPADLDTAPDVFVHLVRTQMKETRYICFARFSVKDLLIDEAAPGEDFKKIPEPKWISLIEDPSMNDLKDHDFTGNVLLNLRLEPAQSKEVAKELSQIWREHSASNLSYTKYTVFVHVFQAKCLPAADTNGLLDPYVKVTCGGAEGKGNMRLATRDPCFYETLALDVDLPQDPVYLPKVSVQVFDWDQWDTDDYIGAAKFSLTDFRLLTSSTYNKQRASGEYQVPRPKWYPISLSKEGDTEGELLLSFELIRKETPGIVIDPPESIKPPMEDRYVEITCLGCRGLQPVGFMPINTPKVKFQVGETNNTNGVRYTNPSSKPSGRNPNFLERVIIPVKMPLDALYAPRLSISVYDQLLGGFYQPLLGSCSVDLSSKMEYSNGQPNPKFKPTLGAAAFHGNPYIAPAPDFSSFPTTLPPSLAESVITDDKIRRESRVQAEMEEESKRESEGDTGAGLAHIAQERSVQILQCDLDGEDDTPAYLRNRDIIDGPLEPQLTQPFETFSLFRGDMLVRKKFFGGLSEPDIRPVGRFKGMIRLLKHKDEPPLINLDQFLAPHPYLVRVYVLDASNIQPKDENNKSDPYLRVSLGDGRKRTNLINDRENYRKATLTPKFHKMYEFKAELPGASELRVEMFDYDFFALPTLPTGVTNGLTIANVAGGDDFIGSTIIDLEDRWFSQRWQELGQMGDAYEKRKPLEIRPLYAPLSTLPQGNLRLWVDILTEQEMAICKPVDISLPPVRQFEVRVIVYKAKNVTPGDFTDLSDLYVKSWLQSHDDKVQTTDTHWRARDGKASFNWRMKFNIDLPIEEDNEADKGYLHLQLWDKDLLYDDCLADTVVDLSMFLKQAYKTNSPVNVFAKKKEVRMRGTSRAAKLLTQSSSTEQQPEPSREGTVPTSSSVTIDVISDLKRPLLAGVASQDQSATAAASQSPSQARRPQSPSYQTPTPPQQGERKTSSLSRKEKAESLVKNLRQRFGMGDDPEDASWLTFTTRDEKTGDRIRAGELLISVEILPVAIANTRAAGFGRSEPNNFPYLAEPADRLHLSAMWNPLYVLEALVGPKYYGAFMSGLTCALIVALLIFAGPLINTFVMILEGLPFPAGLIVFAALLLFMAAALVFFTLRCRRAINTYQSE